MRIDFFICRHGQTDKNVEGVWQGCKIDVMLNANGVKQAEELAKKLRFKIMDVYSSPMVRAVQTANVIAKTNARGCDVVIMQDLRECDFGEAEGVSFVEIQRQYGLDFVNKIMWPTEQCADLCFPNGESKRKVFERVEACLKRIARQHSSTNPRHKVCVVCHAGVLSALQYGLGLKDVSYEHCSVLHLQYDTVKDEFLQRFD